MFAVVILNDFLIALIVVDPLWIGGQHGIQTLLNQVIQILENQMFLFCLGKFPPQQVKIDFADVKLARLHRLFLGFIHLHILADDLIDFHHQLRIVAVLAPPLQLVINRFDGFVFLSGLAGNILVACVLHHAD